MIRNETPFEHALALGPGSDRKPRIAVVLKATFTIPERADAPPEVATPRPIATADEYADGDVLGSLLEESELVAFKPRADVVVVGQAHAPNGRPHTALTASIRLGRHGWALRVTGERRWLFPSRAVLVPLPSDPEPFTAMPLRYERAFGGFDHRGRGWCPENPIGRGFRVEKSRETVHETLLPNLEAPDRLVRSWDDRPPVAGFGLIRRDWQPRAALAGRRTDFDPVFGLPSDFDAAFFNAAHPDLQIPYPEGDERVELVHLTPDGFRRFRLPGLRPEATLRRFTDGLARDDAPDDEPRPTASEPAPMHLDTVVFFPDDGVFTLTWRASWPIRALSLDEVAEAIIRLPERP